MKKSRRRKASARLRKASARSRQSSHESSERRRTRPAARKTSRRARKIARSPKRRARRRTQRPRRTKRTSRTRRTQRTHRTQLTPRTQLRWNPAPDDVQRSVVKLVLSLVEFVRKLMERQAIRRVEEKTLTHEEIENVGVALMKLEETVYLIAKRFKLDPKDSEPRPWPRGPIALTRVSSSGPNTTLVVLVRDFCASLRRLPMSVEGSGGHTSCCVIGNMNRRPAGFLWLASVVGISVQGLAGAPGPPVTVVRIAERCRRAVPC